MSTILRAPWPNYKVTSVLPNPKFGDVRSSQSTLTVKRTMTGRVVTYIQPSDRETLVLPFELTRAKSLEVEAFINAYQSTTWFLELQDEGSQWEVQLVGDPLTREATDVVSEDSRTGRELVLLTLTLSAKRLNP